MKREKIFYSKTNALAFVNSLKRTEFVGISVHQNYIVVFYKFLGE